MNIAIITGGLSAEREVSIASARNLQQLIDFAEVTVFTFPEDTESFIEKYKNFDVAIPVIHGMGGEDGSLQGFFETCKIPYLFSGITTHGVAINKRLTKQLVQQLGITVAKEIVADEPCFPLFAKPNRGGSSVASGLCNSEEALSQLLSRHPETDFILEEPLKGREFTVGIIEYNGRNISLPVMEIVPRGTFFDYESKYDNDKLATEICPAEIDGALAKRLQGIAMSVHEALSARHVSRSDFIVTPDGSIYFLEINTIPGMTHTSILPKMLDEAGISLNELLREWTNTC